MKTDVSKSRGICSGRVPLVIDNMPSPQSGIWYALEILKSEVQATFRGDKPTTESDTRTND